MKVAKNWKRTGEDHGEKEAVAITCFSGQIEVEQLPACDKQVGIDLGLSQLAVTYW